VGVVESAADMLSPSASAALTTGDMLLTKQRFEGIVNICGERMRRRRIVGPLRLSARTRRWYVTETWAREGRVGVTGP
jgi:hypothetical protein